ncbi:MAG: hypothetical protein JW769_02600 [Parachlamydiales bacterium]|nr:hypothetical protein [Parachlamydiales bacterium]
MKRFLFFFMVFSVTFVHAERARDAVHNFMSPECDWYHNKQYDYYFILPKPLSDWQINDKESNKVFVSYKNIPFFTLVTEAQKYDIDCNKHSRYKGKIVKTAESLAKKVSKGLEIEKSIFKKFEENDTLITHYVFIEGKVDGKKTYHFITSSDYQWFNFSTILDKEYPEDLNNRLETFAKDLNIDFGEEDEEDDWDYEDEDPWEIPEFFFKIFMLDLYVKRSY